MIERVARAMVRAEYEAFHDDCLDDPKVIAFIERAVELHWRSDIRRARAAIEALREPTPDLVKAGGASIESAFREFENGPAMAQDDAREVWEAMIDAAQRSPT